MTDAAQEMGRTGRRIEVADELAPEEAEAVLELIERAVRTDGQHAVSEQGRLQLRGGGGRRDQEGASQSDSGRGGGGRRDQEGASQSDSGRGGGGRREGVRHVLVYAPGDEGEELVGYGQLEDTDPVEAPAAELVVHPGFRGRGHGRALGAELLNQSGHRLRVWAHGGHPAARHLAQTLGLTMFRELRQMRRSLADLELAEPVLPEGVSVRTFQPGVDDVAWLEANAEAFAHHPEQGSLTQRDLDDRKAEPWFDPKGFFLAEKEGRLVGFHWTKVHAKEGLGEVYVLGVRPGAQGGGLGKALTSIGLRHLAGQGLPTAMLYVDADNKAAVSVYERLGFMTHETDLMYRSET